MRVGVGGSVRQARRVRSLVWLFVVCALMLPLAGRLPVQDVAAQEWSAPRIVFVPTTGHTTDGYFLDVWRSQRALFGDPVTEEIQPRSGFTTVGDVDVVQYYEHLALIYLPEEAPELQVQALDLGRQALADATKVRASHALRRALERTLCSPGTSANCLTVVATGHTVRGAFLTFWQADGVADWLGTPLSESFTAPDGTRVQYFENGILRLTVGGLAEPLPLGKIAAHRAKFDTKAIPRPEDVPEYDEALFIPPPQDAIEADTGAGWGAGSVGPGPQQGAWKEIVVSISAQSMWAYEGDELVSSSYVSTGTADVPETVTPVGSWTVLAKFDVQDMEGTISDEYYFVEAVPYVMYFDNLGNAIHGTYWHSNFGTPMSHGCVNLPLDIAAFMYEWAPVGTAVTVVP